jgi:hypothetical protein
MRIGKGMTPVLAAVAVVVVVTPFEPALAREENVSEPDIFPSYFPLDPDDHRHILGHSSRLADIEAFG